MNTNTQAEGIPAFLDRTNTKTAVAISPAKKAELATPVEPPKAKAAKPAKRDKLVEAVKREGREHKPAKATKAKAKTGEQVVAKNPRSIVPVRFKQAYAAHNDTCGTRLALALKEATTTTNNDGRECLDVNALKGIAKANGVDFSKYEKLNNGQKRMNVGNKLVGLLKSGTTVIVGKQKFANAEKALHKAGAAA